MKLSWVSCSPLFLCMLTGIGFLKLLTALVYLNGAVTDVNHIYGLCLFELRRHRCEPYLWVLYIWMLLCSHRFTTRSSLSSPTTTSTSFSRWSAHKKISWICTFKTLRYARRVVVHFKNFQRCGTVNESTWICVFSVLFKLVLRSVVSC